MSMRSWTCIPPSKQKTGRVRTPNPKYIEQDTNNNKSSSLKSKAASPTKQPNKHAKRKNPESDGFNDIETVLTEEVNACLVKLY